MRIGIGIDTGGTYTDGVIYDFDQKNILYSSKALTTREDLAIGIGNALDGLPEDMLKKAEIISLSTTLATNACVEEKGGRGKLIFIGGFKDVVDQTGQVYGLPTSSEILFLDGEVNLRGEIVKEPDWDAFIKDSKEWIKDADAVAVVQHLGVRNPESEKKAKELIMKHYGVNTICGHELFSDLNYIKRGASTLLNARLMPVIEEFLKAIKFSLEKRNISAPVVIVRSDGSLMSEKFTTVRPVETLLCGPAASVKGGIELTGEKDCLIIDMGGTTTDIAIVKDGIPVKAKDGVNVGKWRTFVKAVYIDTFGLGGDSAVRVDRFGTLELARFRVVPLCIAAQRWPQVREKLKSLVISGNMSAYPLTDFFYLVNDIQGSLYYTDEEVALCKALKDGPLIFSDAVKALDTKEYKLPTRRLEKEGVIMRCGLTPTDIMHIKGDFKRFDSEASRLGAEYGAYYMNITVDELCDIVYDKVKFSLYSNIVRMLFEDMYPDFKESGIPKEYERLIQKSWERVKDGGDKDLMNLGFTIPSTLVGIGAPIHVFLPDVAKAFNTKYVIPENAGVANALGAVVGNITATSEVEIKPEQTSSGISGYIVFGKSRNSYVKEMDEAIGIAITEARKAALDEAQSRGASGDITVSHDIHKSTVTTHDNKKYTLLTKVTATAVGRVML